MSGETNKLVALAEGAAGNNLPRELFDDEYDVVVASGEQVTAGLLALALRKRGLKARSWLGWQLKLKTNKSHGKARIVITSYSIHYTKLYDEGYAVVPVSIRR